MTLTTANIITLSRLFIAPMFLVFVLSGTSTGITVAIALFALAALTDWLDGAVARSYQEVSEHGAFLDPLADKVLTSSAFVAFYMLDIMPLWMVLVIILRDFGTTVLRSIAEIRGHPLVTSWHAKVKTFAQMVVIVYILSLVWGISTETELCSSDDLRTILSSSATYYILLSLTLFTVWTALEYAISNRHLFFTKQD